MTGEMSRDEVTREEFPLHFALADTFDGATVNPFDWYQGPYVHIPGRGRIWLMSDDGYFCRWYSEQRHQASLLFIPDKTFDEKNSTEIGIDLIEHGGYEIDEDGNIIDAEEQSA